jgi:hypothetical protein
MRIDLDIAYTAELEINDRMPGKQSEHVIEKRDARLDPALARSIEVQFESDVRLAGNPMDRGAPSFHGDGVKQTNV